MAMRGDRHIPLRPRYRARHILAACPGMTRRRMNALVETGVITPHTTSNGQRTKRKYARDQVVQFVMAHWLCLLGVSFPIIQRIVKDRGANWLAYTRGQESLDRDVLKTKGWLYAPASIHIQWDEACKRVDIVDERFF